MLTAQRFSLLCCLLNGFDKLVVGVFQHQHDARVHQHGMQGHVVFFQCSGYLRGLRGRNCKHFHFVNTTCRSHFDTLT